MNLSTKIRSIQKVSYIKEDNEHYLTSVEASYKNFSRFLLSVMMLWSKDKSFRSKIDEQYQKLGGN